MNEYLLLYLITRLDSLALPFMIGIFGSVVLCVVSGITSVSFILAGYDDDEPPKLLAQKVLIRSSLVLASLLALTVIIPSKDEMMLIIAGGKTIEYIKQDKNLQSIPFKTSELVAQVLDKELEKLKEEAKTK